MRTFFTELSQTLLFDRDARHGPLPPLLVAMTIVTGLVDSFSYLALGHVFVANMTGNVVLLGFALAGAHGFSSASSLVALGSFSLGSILGGRVGARLGDNRGRQLSFAAGLQALFLAAGAVLAALSETPIPVGYRYGLIAVLAVGMGIQNATARKLAVPELTTTVLTQTISAMAADSGLGGGAGSKAGRRLVAVGAMLSGATAGAALIVHHETAYPLLITVLVIAGVAGTAGARARSNPAWAASKA